ncbi:hypothetical protein E5163_14815 [Marinicauda algicola]|uniref:Uncharacterized protein n=1 Tax=Marinicauda algicola TaxID=2029849 RepID=A0A4S2GW64_9PROT|nr:hypothetical protein [Marinicauda algicola]TGY87337.1 hypothetical protein E5163_14815 [Marinicauda algicola]
MAANVKQLREETDQTRMPSEEVLKNLARQVTSAKAEMDEARGEIGAMIKSAEETHNVHRKAFKLCLQLDRMDDDKRDAFLAHFDDYREKLKLDRAGKLFAA